MEPSHTEAYRPALTVLNGIDVYLPLTMLPSLAQQILTHWTEWLFPLMLSRNDTLDSEGEKDLLQLLTAIISQVHYGEFLKSDRDAGGSAAGAALASSASSGAAAASNPAAGAAAASPKAAPGPSGTAAPTPTPTPTPTPAPPTVTSSAAASYKYRSGKKFFSLLYLVMDRMQEFGWTENSTRFVRLIYQSFLKYNVSHAKGQGSWRTDGMWARLRLNRFLWRV
jgi:hypothetical protein